MTKPPAARVEPVRENLHGREISDPYRWLEDAGAEETQRFIEEQNAHTRRVLERVPGREKLRARIEQLLAIGRVASPRIAGDRYFYERRDGWQNQPVVYTGPHPARPTQGAGIGQTIDSNDSTINHGSQTINSDSQTINHGSQTINRDSQTINHGSQTINLDSQTINRDSQTINHGSQTINRDSQTINRDSQTINPGSQTINRNSQTINHGGPTMGDGRPALEAADNAERALIDVNRLAPDGTIALDWWYPSEDGRYVAYGASTNGSEISTLHVVEADSGRVLPERIERTRAASVAWLPDSSGFYYTRYPRPDEVPAGEEMYNRQVFFHALGAADHADGRNDPLIFPADGHAIEMEHWPGMSLSQDGRWLLVEVSQGWTKSELFLKDLKAGTFERITDGGNFLYHGEFLKDELYITTNEDAPRFRVLKADCASPQRRNWKEIIPEGEGVIEGYAVIGRKLFLHTMKNASSQLRIFDREGGLEAEVAMPALGSIFDLGGSWNSDRGYFSFISYTIPPTVYEVSLTGETRKWAGVESGIDPEQHQIEQLWFPSKDGTCVPMFVVSRKGVERNGRNPVLLSGYGGFNVGRTPAFNRNAMLLLLEHGGIYADVQLRGGNEFGEEWHRAGMLEKKQNVFDDFIAAAEFLVKEGFTDPDHLAIQGGSNGGLLMGAALTQRPELFRAVICQVPLLDMLRYQRFLIAKLWVPEYGTAEDPEQFEYLYAYSPYHRVKPGTVYPATLFMTAESDTRVDPMHAVKMAALLQAQAGNGPDRPILLQVDSKAGHGMGKPITKLADDAVDVWSFLFWQLGISSQ